MEAIKLEHFEIPVYRTVLPNGLTVITAETNSRRVYAKLIVRAGSLLDGQYPGRAHYLEHIKMEGPSRDGMHPRLRSLIFKGCNSNAGTGPFVTEYSVWGMAEFCAEISRALLDIVFEDRIDPKYVEIERGVILQEYRRKDSKVQKQTRLNQILFPHLPELQHSTLGEPKYIRIIDADLLADFQNSYYAPKNAVLVVAGGVKHGMVVEAAVGCDVPQRETEPIRKFTAEPKLLRTTIEDEQIPDGLGLIFIGTEDRLEHIRLSYAFDILGHFPLGLLIQRLRMRDRRIYGLDLVRKQYPKWLIIGADLPPIHFNYFEEAVFEELERLVRGDYPNELFDLLQTRRRNNILTRAEGMTNEDWAYVLGERWFDGDYANVDEQMLAIKREQVAETVSKYFKRDRYGCVHLFKKRDW